VTEPIWIREDVVLAIHARQINEHGGPGGVRDRNLLSSALARPRHLHVLAEETPDVADLAAAYAYGLCRNHPFVDGNKRVALVVMRLFLVLNGYDLAASQAEKHRTFVRLAAGEVSEPGLAAWIRERLEAREPDPGG
jgi:death on curing protein